MRHCIFDRSPCNRKHVGACVHHDEEEDSSEIEALQIGVVLHHQVQKVGYLFHQDGVEGQQQLKKQNKGQTINTKETQQTHTQKRKELCDYLDNVREARIVTDHPLDLR